MHMLKSWSSAVGSHGKITLRQKCNYIGISETEFNAQSFYYLNTQSEQQTDKCGHKAVKYPNLRTATANIFSQYYDLQLYDIYD